MNKDLDAICQQIDAALQQGGFLAFHGLPRGEELLSMIRWDADAHPDPGLFLNVARELGVRLIVYSRRTFHEDMLGRARGQLESLEISREDYRDLDLSLRKFNDYVGFTCALEISFDHGNNTYLYQVFTPWYGEFLDTLDELDSLEEPDLEDEDDDSPLGGYYSQN